MQVSLKKLRDRAWHSISPETAAAAGMTLGQLQQGGFTPTPEQIVQLARRMGVAHD